MKREKSSRGCEDDEEWRQLTRWYQKGIFMVYGEKQMAQTKEVKAQAMTLRFTDPYVIKAIDYAARLSNQTRTGFLLTAAQEKAEKVIKMKSGIRSEIETMLVSPEAYERILHRLDHPKKPKKRLSEAMRTYSAWDKKNGFTEA